MAKSKPLYALTRISTVNDGIVPVGDVLPDSIDDVNRGFLIAEGSATEDKSVAEAVAQASAAPEPTDEVELVVEEEEVVEIPPPPPPPPDPAVAGGND